MHIIDDPAGWYSVSDVFVCFRAPTWMLLHEPETALVVCGIQGTGI